MTVQKNHKTLTTMALALAVVASLSVSAFAQDTSAVPMTKILLKTTSLVPLTDITSIAKSSAAVQVERKEIDKTLALKMTKSVPATEITDTATLSADEDAALGLLSRENAKTGKLEISSDGGKTWTEFDGKAVATTPAQVVQKP